MFAKRRSALPFLLATSLLLGGCFGTTPPSQFYLLEPLPEFQAYQQQRPRAATPLLALAPVRIPRYVDRPQIVRAVGRNVYQLNELNRWAEALDANIARVLAQDLALLVPAEVVPMNLSNRAKQATFRLSVTILEFHIDPQAQARLEAQWQLMRGDDTVLSRQARYDAPASATDYPVAVQALNRCIDRLARDIAAALRLEIPPR